MSPLDHHSSPIHVVSPLTLPTSFGFWLLIQIWYSHVGNRNPMLCRPRRVRRIRADSPVIHSPLVCFTFARMLYLFVLFFFSYPRHWTLLSVVQLQYFPSCLLSCSPATHVSTITVYSDKLAYNASRLDPTPLQWILQNMLRPIYRQSAALLPLYDLPTSGSCYDTIHDPSSRITVHKPTLLIHLPFTAAISQHGIHYHNQWRSWCADWPRNIGGSPGRYTVCTPCEWCRHRSQNRILGM